MRRFTLLTLLMLLISGCASSPHGKLQSTDRPFDFAIDGEGYFIVETGNGGFLFTRRGNFYVDADRYVVTAEGYRLAPPVRIAEESGELRVTIDGKVILIASDKRSSTPVGQIRLATFMNPGALDRDGAYYLPTRGSGDPVTQQPGSGGAGTIKSGFLEK